MSACYSLRETPTTGGHSLEVGDSEELDGSIKNTSMQDVRFDSSGAKICLNFLLMCLLSVVLSINQCDINGLKLNL